jgi:hypothetical protein
MPRSKANQLHPEFLSTQNLNPFVGNDSASRKQMMAGNMPQALSLLNPTRRILMTGMEPEYAKYVFKIEMPCDAYVIDVIDRVTASNVKGALKRNPETVVVYEDIQSGEVGVMYIPEYLSFHKRFGFELVKVPEAMALLVPGNGVPKGTVFAQPATVTPEGEYMYGRELSCVWATLPGVIEDGGIIGETAARNMSTYMYEERSASFGKSEYPLNLFGDDETYRMCPDVGGIVGDDGVLMAFRRKREMMGSVEMTPERLRKIDRISDRQIKVPPGSEVVNITVQHDSEARVNNTPFGMEYTPSRYDDAQRRYYQRIIAKYRELENSRPGEQLVLSREFHRLVVEALVYINPYHKGGRKLCYRKVELDDWRITVTVRKEIRAGMGIKITCTHGGKGVIVKVMKDEDMPRDKHGRIIDLVMDPMSLTKRMNMGRVIEPRISSVCMEYTRLLREALGLRDEFTQYNVAEAIVRKRGELHTEFFDKFMSFYELISPRMAKGIRDYEGFSIEGHLATVAAHGMQLWLPTDNPVVYSDILPRLRAEHPCNYSQITWRTGKGKVVTSRKEMVVGSIYTIMLEKIARDMAAVSSAKLQINGVPSRIANNDRYSSHIRMQPMRFAGETEVRLMLMAIGGMATRDLLEQTNNPDSHAIVYESIVLADFPTNLPEAIPRDKFPANGHRIAKQIKDLHMCAGIGFKLVPDNIPTE